MADFLELFTAIGYPAAVTIMLGYYIITKEKEERERERETRTAIENNTKVLTKLLTLFEQFFNKEVDTND